MIRHTHDPDTRPGDAVDLHIRGSVDQVDHTGRLLVRYPTQGGSHAWVWVDPAHAGVGVSVSKEGPR
ncbi:hypothetical protein [Nocardiopsis sp. FR26]|uniref:hypothetical protein n=1 Tax=Nocardiopsis sp. FR26 TaxID=2605987 RepID=UPI00135CD8B1|nr:hypothetical protein [Nocardiopsis sp. FR26]